MVRRAAATPRLPLLLLLHLSASCRLGQGQPVYSRQGKHLAVVIPFIGKESAKVVDAVEEWLQLGPICSPSSQQHSDLVLFYHKQATDAPLTSLTKALERKGFPAQLASCFSAVKVVGANLTEVEDMYPAGPSNMFFNIFLNEAVAAAMAPYHAMFWLELDTFPIRPAWLDVLWDKSLDDTFWMKGSIYRGTSLDQTVAQPSSWRWVGHINGNALYRLHEPRFTQLLHLVKLAEPPNYFWKPFDVSIWKYLNSFPYNWRLHQQNIGHFVYDSFIYHFGFTVVPENIGQARADARAFLVHGKRGSAGIKKYKEKFRKGGPQAAVPSHEFTGAVPPDRRISVFLRTGQATAQEALVALQSVAHHLPHRLETVVVVPEDDYDFFRGHLPKHFNTTLYNEPAVLTHAGLQQAYTHLMADTYCQGSYVLHLAPDLVFTRLLLEPDLFFGGRPIIPYARVEPADPAAQALRAGTASALGRDVEFEFGRAVPHLYPHALYHAARMHLEKRHRRSISGFLRGRTTQLPEGPLAQRAAAAGDRLFSEFDYLGAYAYYYRDDSLHWNTLDPSLTLGGDASSQIILPAFTCQGDAAAPGAEAGARRLHVNLLREAITSPAACTRLEGVLAGWSRCYEAAPAARTQAVDSVTHDCMEDISRRVRD